MSPRHHISEADLRQLREQLVEARAVHDQGGASIRLMDRLIRITNERRN